MGSDLSRRIWFTLAALVICRLGTYVPIPGIDPGVLAAFLQYRAGGMLGMVDVFAGSGFGYMSVFTLGLLPYMTVGAILLLAISVSPKLKILSKESTAGRKKINRYIRYGTVILAAAQAYGLAVGLESISAAKGLAVPDPGLSFRVTTVITLTAGTTFLVWLGEQISQRGVGRGALLIVVWVILDTIGQIRARLQPPPGGPPNDFTGAVGARAVVPTHTSAMGSTKRRRTRGRTAAKVD